MIYAKNIIAAVLLGLTASAVAHDASPAAVSRRAAEEGIALLKNNDSTLPFAKGSAVALFGYQDILMCGGGSSQVKTPYFIGLARGLAAEGFSTSRGEDGDGEDNGIVVLMRYSCEGKDAKDAAFELSEKDLKAIEDAKAKCGKVAVIVSAGHLVNLKPLKDDPRVGAILFAWYPGMEGGRALARIVSGAVNPSGRLADTLAEKLSDWPSNGDFRADKDKLPYSEGVEVGYRYFNKKARDRIVYPFGHGLSYTTFRESAPRLSADGREVLVDVRNIGSRPGRHSVLYFENGELSAYAKTKMLAPGEGETLTMRPYRPIPKLPAHVPDEIDAKAEAVVRSLTLEQQVELCSAQPPAMPRGTAGIANLPAFGVPNAQTSDGPNGIRSSRPTTCFPASALLAQTFDDDLLYEVGRALGEEAASNKVDILLGPG
ncbi:MAG: glycoside hydrolase family 3 C-terminal domain-containing protein, partial [Kiritimatiellae bacterium]|nr:glycoside hydrolase family 3 C-terminal domain-containing protein [Kiritimatiellia bacterium]